MRNEENFQPLRRNPHKRSTRAAAVRYQRRNEAIGQARTRAVEAGCTKMTFATKADAEAHIVRANQERAGLRKALHHPYRCNYCNGFHVTSYTHRFRIRPE